MIERGCESYGYTAEASWPRSSTGLSWQEVAAVATDSHDRVWVFSRGEHRLTVFEPDGTFVSSWDHVRFVRPHGISIGPDDAIYLSDDEDHTVRKYTPDGKLLLTLGASGQPSDTGVKGMDYRTIQHVGPPFHYPTNLALSPEGEMYVTDGYGNARVHKFTPEGRLMFSWGEPGSGPGQFNLPHGIAVDRRGTVYVADRENSRLQLFDATGRYLDQWTDVARPCQVCIAGDLVYVAELGYHAGVWPGTPPPHPARPEDD